MGKRTAVRDVGGGDLLPRRAAAAGESPVQSQILIYPLFELSDQPFSPILNCTNISDYMRYICKEKTPFHKMAVAHLFALDTAQRSHMSVTVSGTP